ncbi:MAG: glycine cleavage system protein GcvH [Euryarchaeota archaeon]|jgi:glycine cleavage system H protein|nr:glycine cleavage system protein GcvH [Euryarchaeota archaeon]MBT4392402.1 glycine cleavage system protein GcvH [Euryarchaeota archaeon]MBT4803324.1 glycine cleavage system protein GcvH [Euryarchaeota archaeon]MBT5613282.1 glycine cleavage system protein GcvH [Euryarchaeota archaeon]MBT6683843.1 glycine cleavage system protein GcvH [Euryarchaeota archaeon]
MSNIPSELKYTAEHEWIRIDGNEIVVGITDFAQNALTDVVWVELPEIDVHFNAMDSYASVESVKSVSEIYAPISGTVTGVNELLEDAPETINIDPYGNGWICKMTIDDLTQLEGLLDSHKYEELIGE